MAESDDGTGPEGEPEGAHATGDRGDGDGFENGPGQQADALALLADETRFAILRALATRRGENWAAGGMTFSDLRRAVGVRDAGNFSYHLDRLVGEFVHRNDDEYVLTNHGMELAGALEAGAYTEAGGTRRAETDYDCPHPDCEHGLTAVYGGQYFRLQCPDHHVAAGETLPPGVTDHKSPTELVRLGVLRQRQSVAKAREGVCRHCWGPVTVTLPAEDVEYPEAFDVDVPEGSVFAEFACGNCGLAWNAPAGVCVVEHPAVVALFHEHDRDIRREPTVTLPFTGATHPVVESDDPVRVRVDVELDGDLLRLYLDDETTVVEYERQ
jgi:DNA-binding transcriptional ArsR family regulator